MEINDIFWKASLEHLKKGYFYEVESEQYVCLLCGEAYQEGVIYQGDSKLLEAKKAVQIHIKKSHGSVFKFLLDMDKRYTGVTEHQKELLNLFYEGRSDKDIIRETGGGSTSTIRNQRFTFREKQKQAKVFLAMMELVEESKETKKTNDGDKLIEIHGGAKMVDERYVITEDEKNAVLKNYFDKNNDRKLKTIPPKEKKKIIILQHLVSFFEKSKIYSEKEVNNILKEVHEDYATLRRYLIEYGFMERTDNCSEYWVK
jgi:hypothetical protein